MKHPVINGPGFKIYLSIWAVVVAVHGMVLHYYCGLSLGVAIADGLVHNLIFAFLSLGFWYVVVFASLSKDQLSLLGLHLVASFIILFIWSSFSRVLLQSAFSDDQRYAYFMRVTYFWRIVIGALFYSIITLIFYLIKYYQDTQDRANRELELQTMLKDSELRMLKSQINPHFIFNSLNSISALTLSKPDEAREMVIKLSNFLRFSLGKSNVDMNPLEEEIRNLSLYLDIEKIRFGDRLHFEKEIADDSLKVKVPNLILQPLLENAIKYSLYGSIEKAFIHLASHLSTDLLSITVTNSFDEDIPGVKGEGIGLKSVERRLYLLYDQTDLLKATQTAKEFTTTIKIPLK